MEDSILPSELLQVVRLSLKATAYDVWTANDDETFNPRNPALRKLVEAVLYSREFVLTYYIVVAVLVATLASVRGTKKLLYHRGQRPKSGVETPASYASSSDTLTEEAVAPKGDPERKPLLSDARSSDGPARGGIFTTFARSARSICMYQPRPLPSLTSPTSTLPENGTSIAVLLMLAVNIFYLLYHTELSIPMLFAFADRAGLCFAMNLPVLYVLAAKTNQPILALSGWSYEGLNIFHRRLGEWMTALAAMHSVGMVGVWYTLLRPLHFGFLRFISGRVGLLGLFAFVAYLAIYVSSIGWVRKLFYERFLLLHVVLQVAALVFLFFHHHNSRPYVLASFAVWAIDRAMIRNVVSSEQHIATLEIAPDQKTVLLHCTVQVTPRRQGLPSSISKGWEAAQHVFVTVPSLGYARHRLQTHPFTIASPPPPTGYTGPWQLQLIIRAQDGFSRELLAFAKYHQHVEILLDGPYGSTDTLATMKQVDRVCLIAGGSGIAVTYPLAWALQVRATPEAVLSQRTVYEDGRRIVPQISGTEQVQNNKHSHIWIRQDPQSDRWLQYVPRLDSTRHSVEGLVAPLSADDGRAADLITARFSTRGVHALRPDIFTELREWVELDSGKGQKAGSGALSSKTHLIVVSGPDSLVRSVRNGAARLVREGYHVEVHVEKFGW
ncbi:Ferric transmembrane component 1 [Cyphellophora attinorum]|uniref:Ferric transmembrane component 1 n=1 Tax=Cyphellophora attinorum TaxID=1664694 RepID=A0A0N1HLQ3_9EURO|nr:Ferric transmembrane component 1 [Phialophora attinorum]KPI38014.1 Ferric transmembrane component 1 [Phialophora attinorum]